MLRLYYSKLWNYRDKDNYLIGEIVKRGHIEAETIEEINIEATEMVLQGNCHQSLNDAEAAIRMVIGPFSLYEDNHYSYTFDSEIIEVVNAVWFDNQSIEKRPNFQKRLDDLRVRINQVVTAKDKHVILERYAELQRLKIELI